MMVHVYVCVHVCVYVLCRFLELAQLQANQDADEASVIMQYQVCAIACNRLRQSTLRMQSQQSIFSSYTVQYLFLALL